MPTLYRPRRYALVLLSLALVLAFVLAVHAGAAPPAPQAVSPHIVISQVYGGGGNSGAPLKNDFIELFNRGTTAVNVTGWSVQYASATGSTWQVTALSGTIQPGQYYLVREAAGNSCGGSPCGADLPTPDATGSIAMSLSSGKVALVNNATALSGTCPTGAHIVDFVGYGSSANCYEGSGAAPTLSNTTADLRAGNGCSDTDQNNSDFATGDPNPRNSSSPYNVCSGDAAPYVSSTTPANGATGVAVNADIIVNFSEPVDVSGAWYTIDCNPSGPRTATVSGGPTSFTLNPDTDFTIGDVCTVVINHTLVTDQDTDDPPDQMADDYTWSFRVTGACITIPLIQGAGNASSCLGTVNNIQGCITGIAADGFYLQDVTGDGNAQTSDGIYVYRGSTWDNPSGWAAGDLVSVSGQIIEYYNNTEFQSGNTVTKIGTCTLPTPVTINPVSDPTANPMTLYERFESMRVQMTFNGWVVGPTKRFTSRYIYGDPEIAFVDFSSSIPDYSRVFHSDYPGYQGINYLNGGLNFDLPNLDFGDTLAGANVTGVLGYQFDKYTLLVDAAPALNTIDQPDVVTNWPAADAAKREFDVCFYNVENLFDNHDDEMGDWGDWAPGWPYKDTPAGAAAYQAKLNKTAAVIVNELQSCMLIGLEEMEGKQQVYDDLANAIKSLDPAHTWTAGFVASGDTRNITQGFLWRNDVTLVGSVTAVSGSPYTGWVADGTLDFVRTPPTGQFRFFSGTATPVDIRAYALHFKSKASSAACSTPDCTDRREKEAADLRDILAHHQSVGEYAVGGGDLNDFLVSSPINILDASPSIYGLFHDLSAGQRYSYIFNGESEVLDHVYLTRNLFATAGATWSRTFSPLHVNADFPSSEHASDHDPIGVRFGFYVDDGSGSPGADLTDLSLGYDLAWHKGPHTIYLGNSVTNDATFAPGDDNASDDGVSRLPPAWQPGQQASIRVQVTGGSGWLSGWFDWDLDGIFDADEKTVNQAVKVGLNTISFTIPQGAGVGTGTATQMPVRFRLYESGTEPTKPQPNSLHVQMLAAATGGVTGGEVEDYVWDFTPTAVTLRSFGARASAGWPAWAATLVLGLELAMLTLYAYRRWAGKRSRPAL